MEKSHKNRLTKKEIDREILLLAKAELKYGLTLSLGCFPICLLLFLLATCFPCLPIQISAVIPLLCFSFFGLHSYFSKTAAVKKGRVSVTKEKIAYFEEKLQVRYKGYRLVRYSVFENEKHRIVRSEFDRIGDAYYLVFIDKKQKKVVFTYTDMIYEIDNSSDTQENSISISL